MQGQDQPPGVSASLNVRLWASYLPQTSYRLRKVKTEREREERETQEKKRDKEKEADPRETQGDMDRGQRYKQAEWTDRKHTRRRKLS